MIEPALAGLVGYLSSPPVLHFVSCEQTLWEPTLGANTGSTRVVDPFPNGLQPDRGVVPDWIVFNDILSLRASLIVLASRPFPYPEVKGAHSKEGPCKPTYSLTVGR